MAGTNLVIILGNLGQDPELRYTQTQQPVVTMSIATSEQWTDNNGKAQERTEWHRVVVWGKQAENCSKYLAKGHKCHVVGKLQTRSWDDKDGTKRYTTEIVAREVTFLGAPQGSGHRPPAPGDDDRGAPRGQQRPADAGQSGREAEPPPSLDEIPF